jgi:iron complex transport system ATP-binding protein
VLELAGVGYAYPRRDWVLRGVDLQVRRGAVTAVLGPNGRGKTTLVRCAAGLLRPGEGTVRRDGDVGFVPQARTGAFAYRVIDMVVMGRARQVSIFGTPGREDLRAARRAVERVGIASLQDRQFPTLSGGEQQLVLIARAIAADCPYLVLDEPSTGLDLHNQSRILTLVRELADQGLAVLLTTHHPDHALHVADSVVLMRGSTGVRSGSAAELLTDAALSELYGLPVRIITYRRAGVTGRVIVTEHDQPVSPAAPPLSAGLPR